MKVVIPLIMKAFPKMEIMDPKFHDKKPTNCVIMEKRPEIMLKMYCD